MHTLYKLPKLKFEIKKNGKDNTTCNDRSSKLHLDSQNDKILELCFAFTSHVYERRESAFKSRSV